MKERITLKEALERIEELEKENEELRQKADDLEHNPAPEGLGDNGQRQESYNDFVMHLEAGMTVMEMVDTGEISRRTANRYKEYYEKINGLRT